MGKPAMIYFSSEAMPKNADLLQIQEVDQARQETGNVDTFRFLPVSKASEMIFGATWRKEC